MIFLLLSIGPLSFLIGHRSRPNGKEFAGASRPSAYPLALSFLIFVTIFFANACIPVFGGPGAISQVTGGLKILDIDPAFTAADVYLRMDGFGPQGRELYQRSTYSSDLAFTISLSVFLFFLLKSIYRKFSIPPIVWTIFNLLQFAWLELDMLENTLIYLLLDSFPNPIWFANYLFLVTLAKFCFWFMALSIPLYYWTLGSAKIRL